MKCPHQAPPGWQLETVKTRAYGLWEARLTDPEGMVFTGSGISEWRAIHSARVKAKIALKIGDTSVAPDASI